MATQYHYPAAGDVPLELPLGLNFQQPPPQSPYRRHRSSYRSAFEPDRTDAGRATRGLFWPEAEWRLPGSMQDCEPLARQDGIGRF
jgi:hypothetical protein